MKLRKGMRVRLQNKASFASMSYSGKIAIFQYAAPNSPFGCYYVVKIGDILEAVWPEECSNPILSSLEKALYRWSDDNDEA